MPLTFPISNPGNYQNNQTCRKSHIRCDRRRIADRNASRPGDFGALMLSTDKKPQYRYYTCANRRPKGRSACADPITMPMGELDRAQRSDRPPWHAAWPHRSVPVVCPAPILQSTFLTGKTLSHRWGRRVGILIHTAHRGARAEGARRTRRGLEQWGIAGSARSARRTLALRGSGGLRWIDV